MPIKFLHTCYSCCQVHGQTTEKSVSKTAVYPIDMKLKILAV